jgi:hypothetical protein
VRNVAQRSIVVARVGSAASNVAHIVLFVFEVRVLVRIQSLKPQSTAMTD